MTARALAPAIVAAGLAVQLALMAYLGEDRAYGDVLKAVNYGRLVDIGVFDVTRDMVNSKTFVGPRLDWWIYERWGLTGIRAANASVFVLLAVGALAISRRRFDDPTRLLALFLFAFYVGTQRSIVAGELDDHMATLLLAAGVLLLLERDALLPAALLVGTGFLFKFWVAIYALGLLTFLALTGRARRMPTALLGFALPFAALVPFDHGGSLRALLTSTGLSMHYSTWSGVAFKCLSTGLLPAAILAALAWMERGRRDADTLLLCVSSSYLAYVLLARDAFVASTMMATCLVFSSPLVAAWLVHRARPWTARARWAALAGVVLVYPVATTFVTALHLHRDTVRIRLVETPEEVSEVFRWRMYGRR
jgi:hypothetical protein